jgi:hypothetical protein
MTSRRRMPAAATKKRPCPLLAAIAAAPFSIREMFMKRLLLSVLLGALSLSACTDARASAPVSAGEIVLPARPYKMFPDDWDVYAGKYYLSNGQTMVLRRRGLRMYAEVSDRPRTELVAAAENVFVALDRSLRMTLQDEGMGNISGEMVMVAPGRR